MYPSFNLHLFYKELLHQVMEVPDAQLSEYIKEIHNRCDVQVSKSRISTILKELSISRKKALFPSIVLIVAIKRSSTT